MLAKHQNRRGFQKLLLYYHMYSPSVKHFQRLTLDLLLNIAVKLNPVYEWNPKIELRFLGPNASYALPMLIVLKFFLFPV